MRNWIFRIVYTLIAFLVLVGVFYYFLLREPDHVKLNQQLPEGVNTVKELKSIVDTEVNKYYANDKYYLTRVMLSVDKEHKGEILFYYIEKNHKNPKFLKATVDTALGQLLSLEDTGRNDLEAPYEIYVNEWKVDSQEAYQIAQTRLQHKSKEVFDGISIMTENFNKEEKWYIQLYNQDRTYWCEIDPYTGAVLGDGIRYIIK